MAIVIIDSTIWERELTKISLIQINQRSDIFKNKLFLSPCFHCTGQMILLESFSDIKSLYRSVSASSTLNKYKSRYSILSFIYSNIYLYNISELLRREFWLVLYSKFKIIKQCNPLGGGRRGHKMKLKKLHL